MQPNERRTEQRTSPRLLHFAFPGLYPDSFRQAVDVSHTDYRVGHAVDVAHVVFASGTEFPASWHTEKVAEDSLRFKFGPVALAFGWVSHLPVPLQ
jgi:hypothetical protein